jgi:hypothetical protein
MKLVSVGFLSLCLVVSSVPLSARGNVLDWASVRGIKPGRAVLVSVNGAHPDPGYFIAADNEAMTIHVVGSREAERRIPRADVSRVESAPMKGGKIIGAAAGGLAAGAVGWVGGVSIMLDDTPCQPSCGGRVIGGYAMIIGLPILGAVLGHTIAASSKRRLIYTRA